MNLVLIFLFFHFVCNANYYVSVDSGDDEKDGSSNFPFQSIEKARLTLKSHSNENNIVNIYPGRYDEKITFDSEDSGSNGYTNTYQAQDMDDKPYIFGGKIIESTWEYESSIGAYKTFIGTEVESRQLFVNNRRAKRARCELPEGTNKTKTGYLLPEGYDWSNYESQSNIEFVMNKQWVQKRCLVDTIYGRNITMQEPCWTDATTGYAYTRFSYPTRIENVFECLSDEDEWYLNFETGYLFYKPLSSEPIIDSFFYLGVEERLFYAHGSKNSPIKNIIFNGLIFTTSTWMGPNKDGFGFNEVQANIRLPDYGSPVAAVDIQYGRNVVVRNCIFTQLGGIGLLLGTGTQNCVIEKNIVYDTASIGIKLGDVLEAIREDEEDWTKNSVVSNNKIYEVGQDYPGSPGIMVGYCFNCTVENNELTNLPYSGISVGWGWSMVVPNFQGGNIVRRNYVRDTMFVLRDGGAIYTLGANSNGISKIKENVFLNQNDCFGAVYLDEGSTNWDVVENVIFGNTQSVFYKGGNHYFVDNYWQDRGTREECGGHFDIGSMQLGDTCAPCNENYTICTACGPIVKNGNQAITDTSQVPQHLLDNAGNDVVLSNRDIPNWKPRNEGDDIVDDDKGAEDRNIFVVFLVFCIFLICL